MNQNLKQLLRPLILGMLIPMWACFLFWCLAGITITPSPQSPLAELVTARNVWNRQHILNYRMRISFIQAVGYAGAFNFTVANNRVAKIENADTYRKDVPISFKPDWYVSGFNSGKYFPSSLESFTIDQLFDFAAEKFRDEPEPQVIAWCGGRENNYTKYHFKVKFNKERGYLENLAISNCVEFKWGLGLMCPLISDCGAGFTISNVETIP